VDPTVLGYHVCNYATLTASRPVWF